MTVQLVPTSNTPFYTEQTTLEGTSYLLSFTYSQREDCWYVSIADANAVDIYNGVKLIVGNPLLFKCRDPRRPGAPGTVGANGKTYFGEFFVMSSTTDTSPPGLNDLVPNAGRCQLLYVTSDVVALIANGQLQSFLAALQTNTTTGTASTYGQQ